MNSGRMAAVFFYMQCIVKTNIDFRTTAPRFKHAACRLGLHGILRLS